MLKPEATWISNQGVRNRDFRKDCSIVIPCYKYLDRRSPHQNELFLDLEPIECRVLHDFLQMTLRAIAKGWTLEIHILPTGNANQAHIPANVEGIVNIPVADTPTLWSWPDPRSISSRLQRTVLDAEQLDVHVMPCIEPDLPVPLATTFRIVIVRVPPVPVA